MKRLSLSFIIVLLLLPSVSAVTKPVQGFLGTPNANIDIIVKIHSAMDSEYWCTCDVLATSNDIGEFVQDFGNLVYLNDCQFWQKEKGEDCSNDWNNNDKIKYIFNNEESDWIEIDQEPIIKFNYEERELKEKKPTKIESKEGNVSISKVDVSFSDNELEFAVSIDNHKTPIMDTELVIQVKDVSGQLVKEIKTQNIDIENMINKVVIIKPHLSAGIYSITAMLYLEDVMLGVSKTFDLVIYDGNVRTPKIPVQDSPKYMWMLYGFGFMIVILLIAIIIEVYLLRKK